MLPFDGVVAKCVAEELTEKLVGGRIDKVFQPENDEIVINIRVKGKSLKVIASASPNYPRVHITEFSKENPDAPPMFCMLMRKHLSGGKITGIEFHDYERIITVLVESLDELGDVTVKKLIIEIMGRHSNIILIDNQNRILDSIKHVGSDISRIREVMPGKEYALPPAQNKTSPTEVDVERLFECPMDNAIAKMPLERYLLSNIKGFSPLLCREICHRSGIDEKMSFIDLYEDEVKRLKYETAGMISSIRDSSFTPCIIFEDKDEKRPVDFHCLDIKQYVFKKHLHSISEVLDLFYSVKDRYERQKQKKSDIVKLVGNNIERCNRKLAIWQEALRNVSDRDKLRLYGELITANIYSIPKSVKSISLFNYYSENEDYLVVPLEENLTPQENAQKYFKRYAKAKTTYEYTNKQLKETLSELEYLESVVHMLENSATLQEINEVRQELSEQGYFKARKKGSQKKQQHKLSEPMRYKSSDGIPVFAGRNNRQNDLLTMKTASSGDIWLHARNIPGSHVIIKKQHGGIPDRTLLEAAIIASYHSKAKMSSGVPVDYTEVKNVKKPPGAKPGMVIYEHFKTIIVTPDEALVEKLKTLPKTD